MQVLMTGRTAAAAAADLDLALSSFALACQQKGPRSLSPLLLGPRRPPLLLSTSWPVVMCDDDDDDVMEDGEE